MLTWDKTENGYFYLYMRIALAPDVQGFRFVSTKRVGDLYHHAYRKRPPGSL